MTFPFRARRRARALALAAAAALTAGLATAPAGPATATAADDPPTVSGTVTDAVTGAPVEGVNVDLRSTGEPSPGGDPTVGTAADGTYLLTADGPGTYTLAVTDHFGRYVRTSSAPFELAAGEQLTGRDFRLTAGATITGFALDATTGEPVQGSCPTAFAGRQGGALPGHVAECSGADGRWVLQGLPAGQVTLRMGNTMTHAAGWALNATTQAQATVFTVSTGATTDAGTVAMRRGGVITGRVTNRAGEPVADATVLVIGGDCEPMCDEGITDADGRYRVENVRPGEWILRFTARPYAFQWNGGATDPASARRLRVGYETTTTVNAVLQPEAKLTVTVTGAAADEWSAAGAYTLSGAPVGWSSGRDGPGAVTIGGLPAGRVKVRASVLDEWGENIRRAWYGGTSVENARPVRVAPGLDAAISVTVP